MRFGWYLGGSSGSISLRVKFRPIRGSLTWIEPCGKVPVDVAKAIKGAGDEDGPRAKAWVKKVTLSDLVTI